MMHISFPLGPGDGGSTSPLEGWLLAGWPRSVRRPTPLADDQLL